MMNNGLNCHTLENNQESNLPLTVNRIYLHLGSKSSFWGTFPVFFDVMSVYYGSLISSFLQ